MRLHRNGSPLARSGLFLNRQDHVPKAYLEVRCVGLGRVNNIAGLDRSTRRLDEVASLLVVNPFDACPRKQLDVARRQGHIQQAPDPLGRVPRCCGQRKTSVVLQAHARFFEGLCGRDLGPVGKTAVERHSYRFSQ